jgi:glutathionylspermidine synthase
VQRVPSSPRPGWRDTIAHQGLVFSETTDPATGISTSYWNEFACYELTMDEVDLLERTSENLHMMAKDAAGFLAEESLKPGSPFNLGIPREAIEYATVSLDRDDPSLYSRFDLIYSGNDGRPPRMLEYNADTPTGLVEAALIQWYWHEDVHLKAGVTGIDQWNGIHEELIAQWGRIDDHLGRLHGLRPHMYHFAYTDADDSGEDLMTTGYLMDTAIQAGLTSTLVEMKQLGLDRETARFTDGKNRHLEAIFKLYPWEEMMFEEFGPAICALKPDYWFQPAWTMFLSTKALSAALWHLYPNHPNLIPTYMYPDEARARHDTMGMSEYAIKPLHAREGANIELHGEGRHIVQPGGWGIEGYVIQEFCKLPDFTGSDHLHNRPVLGTWMVGNECYGLGIRESDGPITDYYCRFVPNRIRL